MSVVVVVGRPSPAQILNTAGAETGDTRDFAMSNLAALKQESGDVAGAIEEYREVLA